MSNTGTLSLLGGLVKGYTEANDQVKQQELMSRKETRDAMLAYLGHMSTNPNIPPEHQQWAMQQIPLLAQHDITKKLPKGLGDLSTLPPVTLQPPPNQTVSTTPAMTLQAPQPPSGAQEGPSGEVGRAPNGTVNALGQIQAPINPVQGSLQPPASVPVGSSMTLPATSRMIQNPQPPVQIAPGGAPHVLTQNDKMQYAGAAEQQEINRLQGQYPDKSREQLAYYAVHGEFPKAQVHNIPSGGMLADETGRVLARNEEAKPGAASGYSYERGPSGEVLVRDNKTKATLSDAEINANPQAKAVRDTAQAALAAADKKAEDKEDRQFNRHLTMAATLDEQRINRQVTAAAVDASKKAKPMVDVLDTSEKYMKAGVFTPRQDLALVVRAVRAMNPGTVRLPQKELELELKAGSYGDRFSRWFTTASTGVLPADQRNDLMNVIREETTQTATSAAQNWRQAFQGSKPLPTHLQRFGVQAPQAPQASDAIELPPEALSKLQEGHQTTFGNGQTWMLSGGKPLRIK